MKIQEAIKHFGSASGLARALGISKQAVCKWHGEIPEGRQYQLQIVTKGKLRAEHRENAA